MVARVVETVPKLLTVRSEKGSVEFIGIKEVYSVIKDDGKTIQIKPKGFMFVVGKREVKDLKDVLNEP